LIVTHCIISALLRAHAQSPMSGINFESWFETSV
jgi:hypothetical protein